MSIFNRYAFSNILTYMLVIFLICVYLMKSISGAGELFTIFLPFHIFIGIGGFFLFSKIASIMITKDHTSYFAAYLVSNLLYAFCIFLLYFIIIISGLEITLY